MHVKLHHCCKNLCCITLSGNTVHQHHCGKQAIVGWRTVRGVFSQTITKSWQITNNILHIILTKYCQNSATFISLNDFLNNGTNTNCVTRTHLGKVRNSKVGVQLPPVPQPVAVSERCKLLVLSFQQDISFANISQAIIRRLKILSGIAASLQFWWSAGHCFLRERFLLARVCGQEKCDYYFASRLCNSRCITCDLPGFVVHDDQFPKSIMRRTRSNYSTTTKHFNMRLNRFSSSSCKHFYQLKITECNEIKLITTHDKILKIPVTNSSSSSRPIPSCASMSTAALTIFQEWLFWCLLSSFNGWLSLSLVKSEFFPWSTCYVKCV